MELRIVCLCIALWMFAGCGASTGTGLDTVVTSSQKVITISEVLAVDDKIIGGSLIVGTSLDSVTGKIVSPIDIQSLNTDSSGKVGSFSLNLDTSVDTLFFQVSGGTNGTNGDTISSSSSFLGVIELEGTSNVTKTRVNINPLSTLIAYTKFKSPQIKLSNISSQAVSKFFQSTAVGSIDINSVSYLGNSSSSAESNGDGPLFQLLNEMIKLAAKDAAGSGANQIANFTSSFYAS
ncbi:hypothetical protein MJH12_19600, partial [bacterium]|nr:hypothetical protein [bacterium]